MQRKTNPKIDPEIAAISHVNTALTGLSRDAQARVMNYVAAKLKIDFSSTEANESEDRTKPPPDQENKSTGRDESSAEEEVEDELEGINPVARKWVKRNGLKPAELWKLFSISGEGVDLITSTVPGDSKRQRMRSVFLLMGIAAYLENGAARFDYQQVKEACLQYDAYDSSNFSKHVADFAGEISGSKDTGYSLTPRGMTAATEMVKQRV